MLSPDDKIIKEKDFVFNGIKYTAEVILQAAYLVLIFKNKDKDWDISDNLSIGACVENMILYATDIGIGSLWIRYTYCIQDEISEAFGNGGTELVCSVAFGIHAEIKENKSIRDIKSIAKWV